ncbi:MAG: response regulator transcription factor [Acidimicrobiia bacterium]|nr:response regulator transcription factor [Acidimicrobiia bacterium]
MASTSPNEQVVVVIEDDASIADLVELYLRREGYRVHHASDGTAGLRIIEERRADIVILDVGLPGELDGFAVCRAVRERWDLPVIMLTARDGEIDRVVGLEMGADDYVVKPFSPRELMARVKNVLRRTSGPARSAPNPVVVLGPLEVDLARREARVDGVSVQLAAREFDLLAYLAEHRGLALSRRQLLDGVWGNGWVGDERTVDVHVRQLRKKLGDAFELSTVWGVGYRME